MAKARKKSPDTPASVNIQQIDVHALKIDRTRKDLAAWRTALDLAESVINPNRRALMELYAQVVLDPHLSAQMDTRKLAISNTALNFVAGGEPVEAVQALIETGFFQELLGHVMDSIFYGYSLVQFSPNLTDTCTLVDRRHVKPQQGIVVYYPTDTYGVNYTEPPYDRWYLGVGNTTNLGLLLKAARYVILKEGDVADWAQFNELFGMPTRVAYYDPSSPQNRLEVKQAMEEAGSSAIIVLPEGSTLDFKNSNFTGTGGDTYSNLADFCDAQISKLIVGQTLTASEGEHGTQALGKVHEGVAARIARSDRKFVLRVLESRVKPMLAEWGFPVEGGAFQWVEEEETLTIKEQFDIDQKIHTTIGKLPAEYWEEQYNVTFANPEEVTAAPEPAPAPGQPPAPAEQQPPAPKEKGQQQNTSGEWLGWLKQGLRFFGEAPMMP